MKRLIYSLLILVTVIPALCLTGCSAVMDDEPTPCPQGLEIRFIYNYNLERANAFPAQVDCLILHIYDEDGNFVRTITEESSVLADEEWRMKVNDLEPGRYRLIAYGGAQCGDKAFDHIDHSMRAADINSGDGSNEMDRGVARPEAGSKESDIGMELNPACLVPGSESGHLHDHFYGTVYADVIEAPTLQKVTVKMMKNTNHFHILLQHLNYEPLDGNDYDFEIIDDNTLFDHTNDLLDNGEVTYTPWQKGSVTTGSAEAGSNGASRTITEVRMAAAELSTSRLMLKRSPTLKVRYRPTGEEIISIPLNNYLLALQGQHFAWAGRQEFLDRKSDWQLFFFLDDKRTWNKSYIRVDDWIVRINEISGL